MTPIQLKEKHRKKFLAWAKAKEDGYREMLTRLEEAQAPEELLRDVRLRIAGHHIVVKELSEPVVVR